MRRLVDHSWLVGSALVVAVVVVTCVLYSVESGRGNQQQRATQRQAVTVLSQSVDDVLAREVALARVVGTLRGPLQARWPVLSSVVMSQTLANSTAFIQPVSQRDRAGFERRTGLRLIESPKPGVTRSPPGDRFIGGWSDEGLDLTAVPYALDGVTASAAVYRSRPACPRPRAHPTPTR